MPDMCGFVGIDAGMLDDNPARNLASNYRLDVLLPCKCIPKGGAVKESVQIAATGHLHARNAINFRKRVGDFLRDGPRSLFQALCEFEPHRGSGFAKLEFRRSPQDNGDIDAVFLADMSGEGLAQALDQSQVHGSSNGSGAWPGIVQYSSIGSTHMASCKRLEELESRLPATSRRFAANQMRQPGVKLPKRSRGLGGRGMGA